MGAFQKLSRCVVVGNIRALDAEKSLPVFVSNLFQYRNLAPYVGDVSKNP